LIEKKDNTFYNESNIPCMLLYHAGRTVDTTTDFHAKCDDKGLL
jgi:hypothetical protein